MRVRLGDKSGGLQDADVRLFTAQRPARGQCRTGPDGRPHPVHLPGLVLCKQHFATASVVVVLRWRVVRSRPAPLLSRLRHSGSHL